VSALITRSQAKTIAAVSNQTPGLIKHGLAAKPAIGHGGLLALFGSRAFLQRNQLVPHRFSPGGKLWKGTRSAPKNVRFSIGPSLPAGPNHPCRAGHQAGLKRPGPGRPPGFWQPPVRPASPGAGQPLSPGEQEPRGAKTGPHSQGSSCVVAAHPFGPSRSAASSTGGSDAQKIPSRPRLCYRAWL
jgi:hypothetical protein